VGHGCGDGGPGCAGTGRGSPADRDGDGGLRGAAGACARQDRSGLGSLALLDARGLLRPSAALLLLALLPLELLQFALPQLVVAEARSAGRCFETTLVSFGRASDKVPRWEAKRVFGDWRPSTVAAELERGDGGQRGQGHDAVHETNCVAQVRGAFE